MNNEEKKEHLEVKGSVNENSDHTNPGSEDGNKTTFRKEDIKKNIRGGGARRGGFDGGKRPFNRFGNDERQNNFDTEVVDIRPISKTTAGGRQRRMAVLLCVGNKKDGLVGIGTGKAKDTISAIRKAERDAKKNLVKVHLYKKTIEHNVRAYHCGVSIKLHQAKEGSGLKADGAARKILQMAGVEEVVCKCLGKSKAKYNVAKATVKCLSKLSSLEQIANRLGTDKKSIIERKSV